MNKEELFKKAEAGDISILDNPNVSVFRNEYGQTPLHYLASIGKVEVILHSEVSTVKDDSRNKCRSCD